MTTKKGYIPGMPTERPQRLTRRQREVVRLLGQGMSYSQIAERLTVSRRTVDAHVTEARARTGTRSAFELAIKIASGEIELGDD